MSDADLFMRSGISNYTSRMQDAMNANDPAKFMSVYRQFYDPKLSTINSYEKGDYDTGAAMRQFAQQNNMIPGEISSYYNQLAAKGPQGMDMEGLSNYYDRQQWAKPERQSSTQGVEAMLANQRGKAGWGRNWMPKGGLGVNRNTAQPGMTPVPRADSVFGQRQAMAGPVVRAMPFSGTMPSNGGARPMPFSGTMPVSKAMA